MSRLFANSDEGYAWEVVWCNECARDAVDDCPILAALLFDDPDNIPAEIIPQPEGEFHLPPLHLCTAFTPGPGGDPHAEIRANVVAHVTAKRAAP